jgi:hypothetical protein
MVGRSVRFEGLFFLPKIMVEHRRFVALLARFAKTARLDAQVVGWLLLVPSVALAGPKDSAATKLANQAMQTDYVGTQFKKAEQKLKKAIAQCGDSACAYDVVGRLHRDLATVYIGGMNQVAKGKAELKLALAANPDLQLDNDLATPELKKAFLAAGGHAPKSAEQDKDDDKDDQEDKPATASKKDKVKDEDCEPGSEGCDKEAGGDAEPAAPAPEDGSPNRVRKNWLSVHFEQDFLVYSATNDVCATNGPVPYAEAPQYACFQAGTQYGYAPGENIYPGVGNHVASGVGVSTSRILLGFDRLLSSNFSIGARLGFAFGGGPTTNTGAKFLPLHAELRGNYWFGADPFASSGLRPYVGLSVGLAELDGHVPVEYYQDQAGLDSNSKGTLDAWRKTGKTFAGLGFGLMIPIVGSSGIIPEVRAMEMLGATSLAFDASLGYAYGF